MGPENNNIILFSIVLNTVWFETIILFVSCIRAPLWRPRQKGAFLKRNLHYSEKSKSDHSRWLHKYLPIDCKVWLRDRFEEYLRDILEGKFWF